MRSDYSLYMIAIICFLIAFLISFMNYAKTPPTYITKSDVTDLVIMMFSAILGIVLIGLGYGLRPKEATPPPTPPKPVHKPSAPPKPATEKPKKKPEKKAVKK